MPLTRISSPRRFAGLLVAAAALTLSVAACGGGDSDDATGGGNGGGGTNAFAAYTSCLSENGVTITMPSGGTGMRPSGNPSGRPGGYPSGQARPSGQPRPSGSAFPGGGERGNGGGFPGGGFSKPDNVDQATWDKAQAACSSLRPSSGPGGQRGGNGRGNNGASAAYTNCLKDHNVTLTDGRQPDTTDATVKAAVDACKALAPTPTPSASS